MVKTLLHTIKHNQLLRNNIVFFIGSVTVATINYLFYPVLGRFLSPTQFGEVQVLANLSLQVMIVFSIAKTVIITEVSNQPDGKLAQKFLANTEALLVRVAIAITIISVLLSPFIKSTLQYNSYAPILLILGFTVINVLRITRDGYIRGIGKFGVSSVGEVIAASTKLISALLLVWLGMGTFGATLGLCLAGTASLLYLLITTKKLGLGLPFTQIDQAIGLFFVWYDSARTFTLKRCEGENSRWEFGNESSLANLFAKMKFGGRGT